MNFCPVGIRNLTITFPMDYHDSIALFFKVIVEGLFLYMRINCIKIFLLTICLSENSFVNCISHSVVNFSSF